MKTDMLKGGLICHLLWLLGGIYCFTVFFNRPSGNTKCLRYLLVKENIAVLTKNFTLSIKPGQTDFQ